MKRVTQTLENVPRRPPLRPRLRHLVRSRALGYRIDPGSQGNQHLVDFDFPRAVYR